MRINKALLALLLLPGCVSYTLLPEPQRKKEIIVEGKGTADQLYEQARLWFARSFRDSKAVLEISDRVNHQLAGKGYIECKSHFPGSMSKSVTMAVSAPVRFFVEIKTKDNKARVRFENLEWFWIGTNGNMILMAPENPQELDAAWSCLAPSIADLESTLIGRKKQDDSF